MPFPTAPKDSLAEHHAHYMDTFEKRRRLPEEPFVKPGEYENTVDVANAYMRLNLTDTWGQYIVLTHFTRADGRRLVVLQLVNENHTERDPHTEDHLYNIEWPRVGTKTVVRSYPPYNRPGPLTPAERRARDTYAQRRYVTMQLVWDTEEGIFNKGPKAERRPGPEPARAGEPPLPKLCAEEETTIFNCAVDEGGKFLSVCGSKMGRLHEGRGHIQYRFGRPGRVEMEYPGERRRRASDFTLDYKQAQGRSHFARLWFDAGPYRYTVYEEVFAGGRASDVAKEARVEVRTLRNLREAVGVARSFRCLAPVQGSLGPLKGLVAADPAR